MVNENTFRPSAAAPAISSTTPPQLSASLLWTLPKRKTLSSALSNPRPVKSTKHAYTNKETDWIVTQLLDPEVRVLLQSRKDISIRGITKTRVHERIAENMSRTFPNTQVGGRQIKNKISRMKIQFRAADAKKHGPDFASLDEEQQKSLVEDLCPFYFTLFDTWGKFWAHNPTETENERHEADDVEDSHAEDRDEDEDEEKEAEEEEHFRKRRHDQRYEQLPQPPPELPNKVIPMTVMDQINYLFAESTETRKTEIDYDNKKLEARKMESAYELRKLEASILEKKYDHERRMMMDEFEHERKMAQIHAETRDHERRHALIEAEQRDQDRSLRRQELNVLAREQTLQLGFMRQYFVERGLPIPGDTLSRSMPPMPRPPIPPPSSRSHSHLSHPYPNPPPRSASPSNSPPPKASSSKASNPIVINGSSRST
ncbi:hypothetical protein BGZ82_008000 [Podila clonocystis]|nr:hypothetical protein BGZ82_008000 [Podila clonocystis]